MTKLLEQAIDQVSMLQASEQDAMAALVLEELASERRWTAAFDKSASTLERLAAEALAEYDAGKTKPL